MLNVSRLQTLISNRFLELIILPTEQCNFRCLYCYEDLSIGKMSQDIAYAIMQLLEKRIPSIDVLKISWFGGEPLIAKDIVFMISEFIQRKIKGYPHLNYLGGMTTNGALLKRNVFEQLVKLGVASFQISLDGTAEYHDKTRRRWGGGKTFSSIWNNLRMIGLSDVKANIVLRLHLTPNNLQDMKVLVEQIIAEFGHDKRFSLYFKAIENLGGNNARTFQTLHGEDKQFILNQFVQSVVGRIRCQNQTMVEPYVCYAAQTNSFVIRANGGIGKCTVALADERNDIGRLTMNGEMILHQDRLKLWTRGIPAQHLPTLHCPRYGLPTLQIGAKSIPITTA